MIHLSNLLSSPNAFFSSPFIVFESPQYGCGGFFIFGPHPRGLFYRQFRGLIIIIWSLSYVGNILRIPKVIAAEGEQKASRALREAAETIADSHSALQVDICTRVDKLSTEVAGFCVVPAPLPADVELHQRGEELYNHLPLPHGAHVAVHQEQRQWVHAHSEEEEGGRRRGKGEERCLSVT